MFEEEHETEQPSQKSQLNIRQKRRLFYKLCGEFREYKNAKKSFIATTRFNNATWAENEEYRKKHNLQCVYGSPQAIHSQVTDKMFVFVLEMNNDENKIMGIGIIKNKPKHGKHRIYANEEYNRYSYESKYRIDRAEMDEEEEKIMTIFDALCFKGSTTHLKKLRGIKLFPLERLFRCRNIIDLDGFVQKMVLKRFGENN